MEGDYYEEEYAFFNDLLFSTIPEVTSTSTNSASGVPTSITAASGPPTSISAASGASTSITAASGPPTSISAASGVPTSISAASGAPASISAASGAPTSITAASGASTSITAASGPPTSISAASEALTSITAASGASTFITAASEAPTSISAASGTSKLTNIASTAPTLTPISPGILPTNAMAAATNEVHLVSSPSPISSGPESSVELMQLTPFTPKELKVKPKQMRCPKKSVPAEKKDEKYYAMRLKNCITTQRSRETKALKGKRMRLRQQYLEAEDRRMADLITRYESERGLFLSQLQTLQQRVATMQQEFPNQSGIPQSTTNRNSEIPSTFTSP